MSQYGQKSSVNGMMNPIIIISLTFLPATVFGYLCAFPPEYSTPLESLCIQDTVL